MSRYNLQRVSVVPSSRNTHNRFTLSLLCVKSFLPGFLQATTDEREQAQQHDEGPNQRNHPWKINGKAFPTTALRKQ